MIKLTEVPCELEGQPLAVLMANTLRSDYLYHILMAMEEAGVEEPDEILKKAIYNVGRTWAEKLGQCPTPADVFAKLVGNPDMKAILKWDCIKEGEEEAEYHFHRCPLVFGWQRLGLEEEMVKRLCAIGHQIDYGNVESHGFKLEMHPGLAQGEEQCVLKVTKT